MESSSTNQTTTTESTTEQESPQKNSNSQKTETDTGKKESDQGWLGRRMTRVKTLISKDKPDVNNTEATDAAKRLTTSMSERNMEKKEGYLTKKGGYFRKQHKYWFELDPFTEYVSYYTNPSSDGSLKSQLVGSFNLEGSKIESVSDKQQIAIKTKNGKSVILTAESTEEMTSWYNAFVQARDVALASSQQLLDQWKSDDKLKDFVDATGTQSNPESNNVIIDDMEDEEEKPTDKEEEEEVKDLETVQVEGLQNFLNLVVEDKEGTPTPLRDALSKNTITLLIVLRHFGCMLCRQQAGHILQRRMDFATLGVPIVAIGIGTPLMAKSFAKEFSFPGQLFTDQKREVYKALSLRRGLRYALINSKTIAVAKKATKEGYSQGPTTGDVLQLGGAFVVSQKSGFIFEHKERFAGDHANLDEVLTICEQYTKEHPYEQWSNAPNIPKDWAEVVNKESLPASLVSTVDPGYNIESGRNKVSYSTSKYVIEQSDLDYRYYSDNFLDSDHENFYGELINKEGVSKGPFILSIQKNKKGEAKAILRTPQSDTRYLIPVEHCSSSNSILQYLQSINPILEGLKFRKNREVEFPKRLAQFEEKLIVNQYKFGVMYCAPGQSTETDMYDNVKGSAEYDEFLNFLGERIQLEGWKKYTGGLSTSTPPLTGTNSHYTKFQNFEIMFHVSTLLPFKEADSQRIERKKHIGNDVVVIIFKDGEDKTPVDPRFKSQFNHVFVVVSVEYKEGQDTFYRVTVANKPGFPPSGPYLPEPAIFKKSEDFRNFLLTKLINSERAAVTYAAGFRNRIRTRTQLLENIIKESAEAFSVSKEVISKVKKVASSENGSFRARSETVDRTTNNNNVSVSSLENSQETQETELESPGVTPSSSTENLAEFAQKPKTTTAPSPWTTASPVKQPRITVRPFRTQKGGVVMFLPSTMEELWEQATSVLSLEAVIKIRSADTEGEINDVDLIRDGDILFACTQADEETVRAEM